MKEHTTCIPISDWTGAASEALAVSIKVIVLEAQSAIETSLLRELVIERLRGIGADWGLALEASASGDGIGFGLFREGAKDALVWIVPIARPDVGLDIAFEYRGQYFWPKSFMRTPLGKVVTQKAERLAFNCARAEMMALLQRWTKTTGMDEYVFGGHPEELPICVTNPRTENKVVVTRVALRNGSKVVVGALEEREIVRCPRSSPYVDRTTKPVAFDLQLLSGRDIQLIAAGMAAAVVEAEGDEEPEETTV